MLYVISYLYKWLLWVLGKLISSIDLNWVEETKKDKKNKDLKYNIKVSLH